MVAATTATMGIVVAQSNPKTAGSKSFVRYESYKAAVTVAEYLTMGGSLADLKYDAERQYVAFQGDATIAGAVDAVKGTHAKKPAAPKKSHKKQQPKTTVEKLVLPKKRPKPTAVRKKKDPTFIKGKPPKPKRRKKKVKKVIASDGQLRVTGTVEGGSTVEATIAGRRLVGVAMSAKALGLDKKELRRREDADWSITAHSVDVSKALKAFAKRHMGGSSSEVPAPPPKRKRGPGRATKPDAAPGAKRKRPSRAKPRAVPLEDEAAASDEPPAPFVAPETLMVLQQNLVVPVAAVDPNAPHVLTML